MIRIRTLGSCDVNAADRPEASAVLAQPKRFAILTYLAVAAPREFVRRDTLLALFWPETDQLQGRRALRQTIYKLRQSLGSDAIRSRGAEDLGVDPDLVRYDAVAFQEALAAGQPAEAMQQYAGDFLVGFHVPDAAAELEEWIDGQRRRLRGLAIEAAWSLALKDQGIGNPAAAGYWARRLVELDPLDEQRVSDAMKLLARAGDRAGAQRIYTEYSRRLQLELGLESSEALQQLGDSLRLAPTLDPPAIAAEIDFASAPPAREPEQHRDITMERASPKRRRQLWWALPGIAAVVAVGAILLRAATAPEIPVIAVGPIVDPQAADTTPPSNVAADLLSTSLARLTGVQVIPVMRLHDVQSQLRAAGHPTSSLMEAARQTGAGQLIHGSLRDAGTQGVQLDLQVLDLTTGSVVRGYRAEGNDLFGAIDAMTSRIALAYGVPAPRQRIGEVTTGSLAAYRLYDQGLQAHYRDDKHAAYPLFKAALAEDTSFAMAAYYAALTAAMVDQPAFSELVVRASRLAQGAPDRERLQIMHGVAGLAMSSAASAFADTLALRYPLDPNARFAAGDAAQNRGDFLAALREYRQVITLDSLSLNSSAGPCRACDAFDQLFWTYLLADSAAAAERVAREYGRAGAGRGNARALHAMVLARQGRAPEALAAWRAHDSVRVGSINLDLVTAWLDIRNGDFASADERLRRLWRDASPPLRQEAVWYLLLSLRTQGRHQEALQIEESAATPMQLPVVLFELGRAREAAAAFERQIRREGPFPGHQGRHHAWLLTHVATSLSAAGDTTRLAALADSVEKAGSQSAFGRDPRLHHYIRGLQWKARGVPERAAQEFRASIWSWSEGYTRANYELARALLALKRPAEAVHPLQSAFRGDLESSNLYVTRTELHELLAQAFDQLGSADSALVHYRKVAEAWRAADRQFVPRRQAALQRIQELNRPTRRE